MPVPRHDKVIFSGTFGPPNAPVEIWSWSLSFGYIEALGGSTTQVAIRARLGYAAQIAGSMPSYVNLTRTRVARLNAGGKVTVLGDGAYDQGDDTTVVPGLGAGTGSAVRSLQLATVVSWDTDRAGPTGKGRAFLPHMAEPIQDDFRWSPQVSTGLAEAMSRLILTIEGSNLDAAPGSPAHLGPHGVASSKGYFSPSTTLRVGRVPDTMRSRREDLIESYSEIPSPHA